MPSDGKERVEIMRKFKKMFAVLAASALVAAMPLTAMAASISSTEDFMGTGRASITVTLPKLPEGSTANNTYKVYKVFDATSDGTNSNISYKLNGKHMDPPIGFTVDKAGNVSYIGEGTNKELTQEDINHIKDYVKDDDPVATITTTADDTYFKLENIPYGYYYIATTTGTLVTVDSTSPNVTVEDKNTVPTLDKTITDVSAGSLDDEGKNALAQVGSTVSYSATIKVGEGAEGYVFHDDMGTGLELVEDSIKVKDNDDTVDEPTKDTDYTLYTKTQEDTIKIDFENAYTGKLAVGTTITITYDATVTSDALTVTSEAGKNTASLDYGDSSGTNSTPTKKVEVYNAKFTVTKDQPDPNHDGQTIPLEGAGFIIKNKKDGTFYKFTEATTGANATGAKVDWVAREEDATVYTSDADGKVKPFTGLKDGEYTLIEKNVPAGYNKAADYEFTIEAKDYTQQNLERNTTVTNNKGIELPSTGGIGTTVFAVAGLVIMAGAAAVLVIKKRS